MIYSIARDLTPIYLGFESTKYYSSFFEQILNRAVKLINLEPEQSHLLNEKRYDLEGILLSLFPEFLDLDEVDTDSSFIEPEESPQLGFAKKLYINLNNIELSKNDSFSWSQYFGLLALMEIDNYIVQNEHIFEYSKPPENIPNWEQLLEDGRAFALISACQAVTLGETLLDKNSPTNAILKDKISKKAQQAVLKRHQPLRKLKNGFLNYFLQAEDKSNKSELARKYFRSLSEDEQRIICQTLETHKAVRTLVTHLNTFSKRENWPYTF